MKGWEYGDLELSAYMINPSSALPAHPPPPPHTQPGIGELNQEKEGGNHTTDTHLGLLSCLSVEG